MRRQVCKRLQRRLQALELPGLNAYRAYLATHEQEWAVVDACCRITISRFYRDRAIFDCLCDQLPQLVNLARKHDNSYLRCWSAGCASGEEAYTLKLLATFALERQISSIPLEIIATDADQHLLARAKRGCYPPGSLKELPNEWISQAFIAYNQEYGLKPSLRTGVHFLQQDIRKKMPDGEFYLVLCRNLVFTYFQEPYQQQILQRILQKLVYGGILVIGRQEKLPAPVQGIQPLDRTNTIYRRSE